MTPEDILKEPARVLTQAQREKYFEDGFVSVEELCEMFGVSDMTIRRDLTNLEKQGLLLRKYGGATISEGAFYEISFKAKVVQSVEEKKRIGEAAADMVKDAARAVKSVPSATSMEIV